MQAITGVSIAFRHEAGQILDPQGMTRLSTDSDSALSTVIQSLRDEHTEFAIERIVFPKSSDGVYFTHLMPSAGGMRYSAIDPGNAEVLRSGSIWTFPAEAAAQLHYNLMIALPGIFIVAAVGLISLVMLTTGTLHWWPKPGRRMPSLAIRMRARRNVQLRQLHRSTGIFMGIFLSFSLITGTVLATNYSFNGFASTPGPRPGLSARTIVDVDAALQLAQMEFPNHDINYVRFRSDARADVFFLAPERSPRALHQVGLDLDPMAIATVVRAESNNDLWVTLLPLHTGESLGRFGRVLIIGNALILFFLAVTGPIMWLSKTRSQKKMLRDQ